MDRPLVAAFLLVLILPVTVAGQAQEATPSFVYSVRRTENTQEKIGKPSLSPSKITKEVLLGDVGTFGGMLLGMLLPQLGAALVGEVMDIENPSDEAVELVETIEGVCLVILGVTGSVVGVCKAGNSDTETGSSWQTALGAILGGVGGSILYEVANRDDPGVWATAAMLVGMSGSAIGGTIAFNMSRRYKTSPAKESRMSLAIGSTTAFNRTSRHRTSLTESEGALINFREGQMSLSVPRVHLRSDSFGRRNLHRSVNLLNVKF